MTTVKKLIYGSDEIGLSDDADIDALLARIEDALNGQQGHWVEVEGKSHTERILVTQGVQIRVQAYDRKPAKVARVL